MSEFENKTLLSSRLEQIFIMSLTDVNRQIWNSPDQLTVQSKNRGPLLDQYVWNLHSLGSLITREKEAGFSAIKYRNTFYNPYWYPLPVENYSESSGVKYLSPIETFNPVTAFSKETNSNLKTNNSLTIVPVVDENGNNGLFTNGLTVIRDCFIYPAYPVVFSSSVPENIHYGPLFAESLSIKATASKSGVVSLDARFIGGRSIKTEYRPLQSIAEQTFRRTSFYDAAFDFNLSIDESDWQTTKQKFFNRNNKIDMDDLVKIISISLNVNQNFDFVVTSNYLNKNNEQGPKYIHLKSRTVEGSITFISRRSNFIRPLVFRQGANDVSSLILFFGEPFYFPMQNVVWQKPSISASASEDGLFVHEYSFIAQAVDNAVANGFKTGNKYVSEFKIPTPE